MTERATGHRYAAKVLSKRQVLREKKVKYVTIEKQVFQLTDHANVLRLFYTFQDTHSLYYVLEWAQHGDLLGFIRARGRLSPEAVRFTFGELVLAVEHLHLRGIIHRDLKPENVLIDEHFRVKLTDFGTAKILSGMPLHLRCHVSD